MFVSHRFLELIMETFLMEGLTVTEYLNTSMGKSMKASGLWANGTVLGL